MAAAEPQNGIGSFRKGANMDKQQRKTTATNELESVCRLWMAACAARDLRIAELEQQCQALQQRVARLSRLLQRQVRAPQVRAKVRSAR